MEITKDQNSRLQAGLTKATFQLYLKMWKNFQQATGYSRDKNLDKMLVRFIESLAVPTRKNTAEKLLAACSHFFPEKASSLTITRRYLKQLRRAQPSGTKPPMIEEVVIQIAYLLMRKKFPVTAIAILLQFDCYLRPIEVSNIRAQHIAFPGGNILGRSVHKVLLLLPRTKTGLLQSVDIRSQIVIKALQHYTDQCQEDTLLFPNYATYSARIFASLKDLDLTHIGYTLHSVRHGGATMDLINLGHSGLAQIMYRGRWESQAGKQYLQRGAASLLYASLTSTFISETVYMKHKLAEKLHHYRFMPRH